MYTFIEYGRTIMYKNYVYIPLTLKDFLEHESLYRMAGIHGFIGSTDGTHVRLKCCAS